MNKTIELGSFGQKAMLQTGFMAGMRFAGLDPDYLDDNQLKEVLEALGDLFTSYRLTREVEY